MAEQERVGMARIAAKLTARADDEGMNDNKALGQPIKYTGKKDRDFAEWDQVFIVKVVQGTLEMSDSLPTVTSMVRMQMIPRFGTQVQNFLCVPHIRRERRCKQSFSKQRQ